MSPCSSYSLTSHHTQLWNDIKTDDLETVNKNLLRNLRKMANESPVVKVVTKQNCLHMQCHKLLSF